MPMCIRGAGRRLLTVFTAALVALTVSAALAQPALADRSCDAGQLCLWQAKDRGGAKLALSTRQVLPGHSLRGYFINNRVSSVENNTGHDVMLIGNADCNPPAVGGWALWIDNGNYYSNLAFTLHRRYGQTANDRISCVNA